MFCSFFFFLICLLVFNRIRTLQISTTLIGTVKQKAIKFIMWYQHEAEKVYNKDTQHQWNYSTNLTTYNSNLAKESSINTSAAIVELRKKGHSLQNVTINKEIDAQLSIATYIPASAGSPERTELIGVNNEMDRLYSTGKACNATSKIGYSVINCI